MDIRTPPQIGIIADDLTSAADCAAPFVAKGIYAQIGRGSLPMPGGAVVSVDSGSRSMTASQAMQKVAEFTQLLSQRPILYKTVDSTLRGHVAVELEAAFKASGRKLIVFAPAFPNAGRTTVGGMQLVDGVQVSASIYGHDPVHPSRTSVLSELLPSLAHAIVLDAGSQDELNARIAAVPDPEDILWVGSPGMAIALAHRLMPYGSLQADPLMLHPEILVVLGTTNPLSHRQAALLRGVPNITLLSAPIDRSGQPTAVLARLTNSAADRLHCGTFGAVIATGGDTMEAILDKLNVRQFEVIGELESGFPIGRMEFGPDRPTLLAMKAGGFGDEETLRRAAERLGQAFCW